VEPIQRNYRSNCPSKDRHAFVNRARFNTDRIAISDPAATRRRPPPPIKSVGPLAPQSTSTSPPTSPRSSINQHARRTSSQLRCFDIGNCNRRCLWHWSRLRQKSHLKKCRLESHYWRFKHQRRGRSRF
jgi:hypothetical protein